MVLDETGKSQWGWKQNSMISIDSKSKTIVYNPEFYLMKHLSAYVKPGSKKLDAIGDVANTIAFYNEAENNVVFLTYNDKDEKQALDVKLGKEAVSTVMAPKSFNTFVIQL
jgi:glucosylceramidase